MINQPLMQKIALWTNVDGQGKNCKNVLAYVEAVVEDFSSPANLLLSLRKCYLPVVCYLLSKHASLIDCFPSPCLLNSSFVML